VLVGLKIIVGVIIIIIIIITITNTFV